MDELLKLLKRNALEPPEDLTRMLNMPAEAVKACIDRAAADKLTMNNYYQWVYQNKPDWQKF